MFKREFLDVVESVFSVAALEDESKRDEVLSFVEKERKALETKNAAARQRAAKKKEAGDALRGQIEAILTEEPKTVNDILMTLDIEELTPSKVTARMTQLIKAGKAVKETVKIDGNKRVAYTKA